MQVICHSHCEFMHRLYIDEIHNLALSIALTRSSCSGYSDPVTV